MKTRTEKDTFGPIDVPAFNALVRAQNVPAVVLSPPKEK